ncbi:LEM and Ank domain containing protein [Trichuris trichiura]|uniref:LEM and Ank domain containing protein n=1 Tax=Trichuris trichiura TaxID=36087 RepID=A0A077Z0T0_TRITR|nr:LEM and Ank domain containing protein [Trichuris trichiura]
MHLLAGLDSPGAYSSLQERLSRGANPSHRNLDGITPVHVAACWGRFENLELLLCFGGDPLLHDNEEMGALDMAIEEAHWPCVRLIMRWCALDAKSVTEMVNVCVLEKLKAFLDEMLHESFIISSNAVAASPPLNLDSSQILSQFAESDPVKGSSSSKPFGRELLSSIHLLNRKTKVQEQTSVDSFKRETLAECQKLDGKELRQMLTSEGLSVGPITEATRSTYIHHLAELLSEKVRIANFKFSVELEALINGNLSTLQSEEDLSILVDCFSSNNAAGRKWRSGQTKDCFCYFLIDPTVSKNLPDRASSMSSSEKLRTFCDSIFYVGKGKRGRPLQHLIDASKQRRKGQLSESKMKRIAELWNSGVGVVSFHVWQSLIPAEAFTREAAVIDAIGLKNLTNKKRGEYYGPASSWASARKRCLGALLLQKAMQIFILEGQRCFHEHDVVSV